ncbi:hypothetical protein HYPSUDRAFT_46281 [Hypholoma sublateritium FD-334 SS-4]|uniref:Secreted protein n=1 Tax=Hypholoma sublateritium (strain FD-334 SS-4) TaxID=945553 RepID=A0A0D2PAY9_HYPSF|nr:hypothetical protein HYPSUDRAFT_46281 [Hypholoma sublateritium FD-334 SS-4]
MSLRRHCLPPLLCLMQKIILLATSYSGANIYVSTGLNHSEAPTRAASPFVRNVCEASTSGRPLFRIAWDAWTVRVEVLNARYYDMYLHVHHTCRTTHHRRRQSASYNAEANATSIPGPRSAKR